MKITKLKTIQPQFHFIFDEYIYFFAFTLITFTSVIPILSLISHYFTRFFLLWGLVIILYKSIYKKQFFWKNHVVLGLFLLSYTITALVSQTNFIGNMKTVLWLACFFYVCLDAFPHKEQERNNQRFIVWAKTIIGLTFTASAISCMMYLTKFLQYIKTFRQDNQPVGLWGNRLVGVYIEANFAALFALLSIGLSIFLLIAQKEQGMKVSKFYVINIVVQIFFSIWTLSRGGFVGFCVFLAAGSFFFFQYKGKKFFISVLAALLSVTVYGGFFYVIPKITGYIPPIINAQIEKYIVINDAHRRLNEQGVFTRPDHIDPSRPYEQDVSDIIEGENNAEDPDFYKDISSGRLAAWKDAIAVWLKHPWFGVGDKNLSQYAAEINPNGILAKSPSTHNPFIRILVSSGAIGFVLFMFWLAAFLCKYLKQVQFSRAKNGDLKPGIILALLLGFLASCFFLDALFLYVSCESVIFWGAAGYMFSFLPGSTDHKNQSCKSIMEKINWV